jgi:molybdate transport system permease protein
MIDFLNILTKIEWTPFLLTFKLAIATTLILFIIAIPISWYLSQSRSKLKPFLETTIALPIVLPPSVIGFYLLWFFSTNSPIGMWLNNTFDVKLLFSFLGLVVVSCIYSLPFMVQPLQSGFDSLSKTMLESSYVSGKSMWQTLWFVALPNIKPAILTAVVITFAHTVGEFGVVLMVGGSIPGETKVASVAIYELVEVMDYTTAHIYSLIMLFVSFVVLLGVYFFNIKHKIKMGVVK